MHRLNAIQLRDTRPTRKQLQELKKTRHDLYLILDSVQDTYNVGGLFRLADAAGVKKLYLCGATECPPNTRIHKAAVGLENWLDWEYHASTAELIEQVKATCHPELAEGSGKTSVSKHLGKDFSTSPPAGVVGRNDNDKNQTLPRSTVNSGREQFPELISSPTFLAIEQAPGSTPLHQLPKLPLPIYLILGHETHGVSKDVLQLCDHIVEIPMHGINISLNVILAAAIVLYKILPEHAILSPH